MDITNYRGRFAPSPSGELHFGSLLAAMASYADARHNKGCWLLRIDDIDTARIVSQSDQHIIKTLEQCGFQWDETETYQSQCLANYHQALEQLNSFGKTYPCICSRKQIKALSDNGIYPGTCKEFKIDDTHQLENNNQQYAIRIRVNSDKISFIDQIQKIYSQHLAQDVGDFIVFRRDKVFTYQLSVVVDDYHSQITHVVRGFDLLNSTPRQIFLQQLLGYDIPHYAHIPLAVTPEDLKLSKLSHAKKVSSDITTLVRAARFLGQNVMDAKNYDHREDFWQHLVTIWDIKNIPKVKKQKVPFTIL